MAGSAYDAPCFHESEVDLDITFVVPSAKHPIGGVVAIYEFANGLGRLGHEITLVHIGFVGDRDRPAVVLTDPISSMDDLDWFAFERGVRHEIVPGYDGSDLPAADVVAYLGGEPPRNAGEPVVFVQGYKILPEEFETDLYRSPVPKICIAQWLAGVVRETGSPPEQAVYIPYGLKHDKYRVTTPFASRPQQVSMLYNSAPTKAANYGVDVLAELRSRLPEVRAVVFGGMEPAQKIPDGITYLVSPPQDLIVNEIYNQSRVFINSSVLEGFGLACIEAMACGAALVTTSNGGSDDYAIPGETALVSEPADVMGMADLVESLLVDDEARIRLADGGRDFVRRFDWDTSAQLLEAFLLRYLDDPERYQRPPGPPAGET